MNRTTIDKKFQFFFRYSRLIFQSINKVVDHFISACVQPIILRRKIWIFNMVTAIIDHIPRTINIRFSESVSIIPVLYCFIIRIQFVIVKHISHFIVCKTEIFIKCNFCDWKYFKIIKSCKYTFLRYTQTPGQNRKFQTIICFQNILK